MGATRTHAGGDGRPQRDPELQDLPALGVHGSASLPRVPSYRSIRPMRFGLFGSAQAKRGGPDVDSGVGFREFVDYNVEAEALGFVSTFLVEHHFTGFGQISATLSL